MWSVQIDPVAERLNVVCERCCSKGERGVRVNPDAQVNGVWMLAEKVRMVVG